MSEAREKEKKTNKKKTPPQKPHNIHEEKQIEQWKELQANREEVL